MSNPRDYIVGWICAIATEYVAALAFLDEKHDAPQSVSANDNNDYTLGRIGQHNVVIAVLPHGEYGISSAAGVARDMLHSFPNVRIGLMVGIGGGAPSARHNIRLGDVVVSASRNGQGGVFQYDFGKAIQATEFQETGFLNQPPPVLRAAVNGLMAQYESDGNQLEEKINSILEKKPRLRKKHKRPEPGTDRLYQPGVLHPPNESNCSACGDGPSTNTERPERTGDEDNPAIHYGLIASANRLMKDAVTRDALARKNDVLCFEMEAAGLMNHFPCLVIRGICDYSDSHKNKEWQGYAAMTAAAYAKDLLCRIAPSRVEAEKKIGEVLSGIQKDVSDTSRKADAIIHHQQTQEHKAVLDWLTPLNYGPQQSDYFSLRHAGTGQWLLDSPEFKAWLENDQKVLFCPGIPGAGKTILTSVVVNELTTLADNGKSIGVAYVYCNFRQEHEQSAGDLLASLLKQLAHGQSSLPGTMKSLYDKHRAKHTRPSLEEVSRALETVVATYSRAFIVVDALDECKASDGCRTSFLWELFDLQAKSGVNLFVTSRFIPEVTERFAESQTLEIRANDTDVRKYLAERIAQGSSRILKRHDLQIEVTSEIAKGVEGMFLLAKLLLDSIMDMKLPKDIRRALKTLPRGSGAYNHAYQEAMDRVERQGPSSVEFAKRVLLWITCAKRPLTTSELRHALAVEVGQTEFDKDALPEIEDMVSVCAGLVTVDQQSHIIRVAKVASCSQAMTATRRNPNHIQGVPRQVMGIHVAAFFGLSQAIIILLENGTDPNLEDSYGRTALSWAARHGQGAVVSLLLANATVNSDLKDKNGRTPLSWAAQNGHREIAELLLADDAVNPESADNFSQTPLSWAAENGCKEVVELLLAKGVHAGSEDKDGETALSLAAENGHGAVIALLLEKRTNSELKGVNGQTLVLWAVRNGHQEVVKLLLEKSAISDLKDVSGQTFILWAFRNGHEAVAKLLLKKDINSKLKDVRKDANFDLRDVKGPMLLLLAAKNGHEAVDKMLLDTGPLSWPAKSGRETIGGVLLDTGIVNLDTGDQNGWTPLSWATKSGYDAIIKMLLDTGQVDVDVRDESGQTLLLWAAENGGEATVNMLLGTGKVDVDARDQSGQTPLLWAAKNGHKAIAKMFLDIGQVDVNVKDESGRTPLSWAAESGYKAIVKMLLDTGRVDLDARDQNGQTPLLWAARYQSPWSSRSLKAWNGHDAIIKMLLDTGRVDVNAKNQSGQTPLLWVVKNGHEAIVKMFLDIGQISVNVRDKSGRTPLLWATENGHETIVDILLDTCRVYPPETMGLTPPKASRPKRHNIDDIRYFEIPSKRARYSATSYI
ncbi:hypothetical protein DL771_000169 [Monosporascus sp. 5C6A]|nr:hypothetical protein DL771_000169 [Monosporascus sp. 5C6A]